MEMILHQNERMNSKIESMFCEVKMVCHARPNFADRLLEPIAVHATRRNMIRDIWIYISCFSSHENRISKQETLFNSSVIEEG
jgi:hypothetical protein